MTDQPQRAVRIVVALLAVGLTLLLTGCNAATPTPSASAAPSTIEPIASVSPALSTADVSSPALPAGQTDTAWGRIWDALPAAFPVYPGAVPANEARADPVSATFAIDGVEARGVAAWMQAELEQAAFRTEALNGPLEDGGFVLEFSGATDCRIEVSAAPLGGLTTVTVRYGAACPNP